MTMPWMSFVIFTSNVFTKEHLDFSSGSTKRTVTAQTLNQKFLIHHNWHCDEHSAENSFLHLHFTAKSRRKLDKKRYAEAVE